MSLLRSCQQAVSKSTLSRGALLSARAVSTTTQPTIPTTAESQQTEIAQAPPRDVVTADVVSGAPSEYLLTSPRPTPS